MVGYNLVMGHDIRRSDDRSRYELVIDGTVVSFADFHDDGRVVTFPHTVTSPQHRGQGYAAMVVRAALDDMLAAGRTVAPRCWFVADFIDENPEYQGLLGGGGPGAP